MRLIGLVVVLALGLLGYTAAAAQEAGKLWRVGFLSPYSADFDKGWRAALRNGFESSVIRKGRTS
jgi:hypothetical protein